MHTLYIDRRTARLRTEGQALVVEDRQGGRSNLPLHLIDRLVLRGHIELDTALLGRLAEQGISVSLLSGRHLRHRAVVLGEGGNDALRRIGQIRMYDDPEWRYRWSRRVVGLKLRAQNRLLRRLCVLRPDRRRPLTRAILQIDRLREQIFDLRDRDRMMGHEGAAARAYFEALASTLPPSLGFAGRNRRPPRDPFNALLSLGYTLLHGEAVQRIWEVGLDPAIGYFHEPAYSRESLAADFIEPLRPRIDALCHQLVRTRRIETAHFTRQGEACLLSKAGRRHFYSEYERQAPPMRRLLRRVCLKLALHLRERARS